MQQRSALFPSHCSNSSQDRCLQGVMGEMNGTSETIFVVDDDEAVLDATEMLLAANGFSVRTFLTGAEFLATCDGLARGCLVLDIHMPGMDGFAVVDALRARRSTLPVILI